MSSNDRSAINGGGGTLNDPNGTTITTITNEQLNSSLLVDSSLVQLQPENSGNNGDGQSFHILEYNNKLLNQLELNQQTNNSPRNVSNQSSTIFHSMQCLIYWDYENISLSSNINQFKTNTVTTSVFLSSLINRLEIELQQYYNNYLNTNNLNTNIVSNIQIKVNTPFIKVYGDMYQIPKYRRTEFYQNGCHLIDVPHLGTTRKEVVDKMMLTDVLMDLNIYNRPIFNQFINNQSNILPSTAIILLTGDQDFCHLLSRLKYQSIPSVVIIKKDQTQHGGSMYDSDNDQSINTLLQSSNFWIPFESIYNDSLNLMKFEKDRLLNGGGLLSTNNITTNNNISMPNTILYSAPISNNSQSNNILNGNESTHEEKKEMSLDEYIESIAPQTPRDLLPKDIKLISFILLKYLEPLELGNLSSQLVNLNITPKKLKKFIEGYDSSQFIELIKTKNSTNILLVDRKKILKLLPNYVKINSKKRTPLNIQSTITVDHSVIDETEDSNDFTKQSNFDDDNCEESNNGMKLVEPAFKISLEEYITKYLSAPTKRDLNSTDMYLICFILLLEDNMELGALSSRLYQYRVKPRSLKKNLIEFNTMGDKNGQLVGIFKLEQKGNMLFIALTDRNVVMNILPKNVEFIPPPKNPLSLMLNSNIDENNNQLISPNLNQLIPKQTTQTVKLSKKVQSENNLSDVGTTTPLSSPSKLATTGALDNEDVLSPGRASVSSSSASSSLSIGNNSNTSGNSREEEESSVSSENENIEGKKSITSDILMELEDTVKDFKDQTMSYLTVKNHYSKLGFNTKHLQRKIMQLSPHLNVVKRGNEMVIEYDSEKTQSVPSNLNNLQVYSKKEHKIATFHDILKIIEDLSSSYPYEADLSLVGTIVKQLGWRVEGNMKLKDFLQMNDTSQILQFDKTKNNWMIKIKKKTKK